MTKRLEKILIIKSTQQLKPPVQIAVQKIHSWKAKQNTEIKNK